MKTLPANANEYRWSTRVSPDRCYELRAGDEVCGIVRFAGGCGSLATAETAHGVWTLKRQGFLSPRVTVRPAGSEESTGIFKPAWGGGVSSFAEMLTMRSLRRGGFIRNGR